jgi:hypothetical protein
VTLSWGPAAGLGVSGVEVVDPDEVAVARLLLTGGGLLVLTASIDMGKKFLYQVF